MTQNYDARMHGKVGNGEVRRWLEEGARVALYIRHAERPPLDPDDPTFGETLALTEAGMHEARALGTALRGSVRAARLWASPMERTRRTVQLVAEGAGLGTGLPVSDAPEIGTGSVFRDQRSVHQTMCAVGVMEYQLAYLDNGTAPHAWSVAETTARTIRWLGEVATAQLNLFGGHDVCIATILTGLGMARISNENWPAYLTGLARVETGGVWRNHIYDGTTG